MISRRTIYTLLLTLLLVLGLRLWAVNKRDDCDRLNGVPNAEVMVQSGTRTITVPCNYRYWALRQPLWVNLLALFGGVLGVVFIISVINDWARLRARRRAIL